MKQLLRPLAALFLLASIASAQTLGPIHTAVDPATGHLYHLLENSNWTDARAAALAMGGELAVVESLAENTFLTSSFSHFGGVTRQLWIGFTDEAVEGSWIWVNGSMNPFTNWWVAGGAPDNSTVNDPIHGEDYCCVYPTGEWEDLHDTAAASGFPILNGVVELESPGTPYCYGDGSAISCPCANNNDGAAGGCDWGNPAFPGGGVLYATGSASLSANDAYLVAARVESDFGIFFGAANRVNGGGGSLLQDGLRCAGGELVRLVPPTLASGNLATTPLPVQELDTGAAVGVTRRYQYWFRTPTGPCGQMANLTNGFEILWGA